MVSCPFLFPLFMQHIVGVAVGFTNRYRNQKVGYRKENMMRKKKIEKLHGTVKWFDVRKGYGFISDEDGLDYFVHYSGIAGDGFKRLRQGQKVLFELAEDNAGRSVAVDVEPDMEQDTESEPAEDTEEVNA